MTKEEFKIQVHTITDLLIDIAELNTPDDDHPLLSITVSGLSDVSSVYLKYPEKEAKHYHLSPSRWFGFGTDPQKVIRELEEIKRRLEDERAKAD